MSRRLLSASARALQVVGTQRQISSQVARSQKPGSTLWFPKRGFKQQEFGLNWFPRKEALVESIPIPAVGPRPVLVAADYEFELMDEQFDSAVLRKVKKYSAFPSHRDYWDFINQLERQERPQNLYEILAEEQPRCLYFDLDGHQSYRIAHKDIIHWLQLFVRWFFSGDKLGWAPSYPEPVVLTSAQPSKYSCHVIFPQVQFDNYEHQSEYMTALLAALPTLVVDLEGQKSVPVLDRIVDRVPYTRFQLFRGPFACKLKTGELCFDTRLQPEGFFRNDELTCFAGHTNSDYSLPLPSLSELLEWNKELEDHHSRQLERVHNRGGGTSLGHGREALYRDCFLKRHQQGQMDLAGKTPVEQFEDCLQRLHPDRASDWWSWFRISGVTFKLLEDCGLEDSARARIWKAYVDWSRCYNGFDMDENIDMVSKARGKRVSGMKFLVALVQHDNPGLEVRSSLF